MIAGKDIYDILGAILPMYFALTIAYISVRWWRLFTADQCAGINRFLRVFAIPFLSFKAISSNNLYAINLDLFAADSLQKLLSLAALSLWRFLCSNSSLDWMITLFSLSSLPNTLIIGLPIATAMYGAESAALMIQTLVFQSVIWTNVLLVLFEYRAAKLLVSEKFSDRRSLGESSPDDAEGKKSGGESNLSELDVYSVDLNGLTQIFPENKAAGNHVFPETPTPIEEITKHASSSGSVGSESFPAKQKHSGDVGGGSGHLGLIFETAKEADCRADTSSRVFAEAEAEAADSGMTKLVLYMLWKKITRNPNTYSSLFGVVWSLLSFKYGIKMPTLMHRCVSMLSDTSLALSMFSLGTFMASQPNIIACSRSEAASAMAARFLVSPMLVTVTSKLVRLRGIALHTAIIQAAFPQAVLSFVLAKEYNVHPNILSTSVVVGMLIAFPIILLYYLLLGAIFN